MSVDISLIVAVSENGVIGDDNRMPWHIPEDFRYFKAVTMGKPIIMGRKTFESIGRPLPGRTNIVITRNSDWNAPGVATAPNLDEAINIAKKQDVSEIMVIGGAQIYALALPIATSVYLTHVHKVYNGNAVFPKLDPKSWQEVKRTRGTECSTAGIDYDFTVYKRITA